HIGKPHCPDTGVPIVSQTTSDIVDKILALPPKTKVMLLAPVVRRQKGEFRELEANTRVKLDKKKFHTIEAVVDRLVIDEKIRVRLTDSVETALRWGEGVMFTLHQLPEAESKVQSIKSKVGTRETSAGGEFQSTQYATRNTAPAALNPQPSTLNPPAWVETLHSNRNLSPATGKSYEPLTPKHFSFNAPVGACPVCHGLGQKMVFDEALAVPDPEKTLEQGALLPWRRGGKRMVAYYKSMLRGLAA